MSIPGLRQSGPAARDKLRFQLIAKHFDELFWSIDHAQLVEFCRPGSQASHWNHGSLQTGHAVAQTRQRWPGQVHDDDRPRLVQAFLSLGRPQDGERRDTFLVDYRLRSDDGRLRWIQDRGFAVLGPQGAVEQVIGLSEDVTERTRMTRALEDSEREMRIVTSAIPIGIAHVDRDLRYRFVNNALARRLLASTPDQIVGRALVDVLGVPTLALLQSRIDQALAGWTVDFEMELMMPAGLHFLHTTLVPEYDDLNHARGFVSVTEDITERKRALAELNERKHEFKTLAENAPDAIARLDRELRYLYLNRAAEIAFGVGREQYVGRLAAELGFPPAYIDATTPIVMATFASGTEQSVSFDALLGGQRRYFLARAVPELDSRGELESLLMIIYDVSERMRVQIERDRLLASEQSAREQAERATRSRDEFLAIVSHELRSPLNGIQSWAEVLCTVIGAGNPLVEQALAGIKIGVQQQVRMIDDLLDATRITTGKLSLSLVKVQLRPVLTAALDSVRHKADEKSIRVSVDLRLEEEAIEGDSDRLQQVIWNLLSNAIKFTGHGGEIRLTAWRTRHSVIIRVRDNGRGIEAAFMPQLFTRFQRDETGNSRGQDGFGLGLMLVRHLCELHRGSVSAASRGRGHGATFTVKLPLSRSVKRSPPGLLRRIASLGSRPTLTGVRLLLVDDHALSRDAMALLLRRSGAEVEVLGSGEEAARRLAEPNPEWQPNLLICDIAMPGLDGYDTLRRIRDDEHQNGRAKLPAIALTAFVQNEDRIRAHDAGFEMHLSKPVAIEDLIATIAAFVRNRDWR